MWRGYGKPPTPWQWNSPCKTDRSSSLKHLLKPLTYSPKYSIPKFPPERTMVNVLLHWCYATWIDSSRKIRPLWLYKMVWYRGIYVSSDGQWSTTQSRPSRTEIFILVRLAKTHAKDMNWVLHITKDKIRVLKSNIFLRSAESVDMIWLVCCMLHNILLEWTLDNFGEQYQCDGTMISPSACKVIR